MSYTDFTDNAAPLKVVRKAAKRNAVVCGGGVTVVVWCRHWWMTLRSERKINLHNWGGDTIAVSDTCRLEDGSCICRHETAVQDTDGPS